MGTGSMWYCSDCYHQFEQYELYELPNGYLVCLTCEDKFYEAEADTLYDDSDASE